MHCYIHYMKDYLSLVKFSHTIFALPFALVGYFLAINLPGYVFQWKIFVLVLLCMVFARNSAMAFNRYLDRDIDGKNPRTAVREIPAGILSAQKVLVFVIVNVIAFIITTYFINSICFYLSPIAIAIVLFYSYTKRFTFLCHLVLGLGLSLAPVGAYLAVTGTFDWIPIIYGMTVMFWVAGFDIIYALQDIDFDLSLGLNSTPAKLGKKWALVLSYVFHVICSVLMILAAYSVTINYLDTGWMVWMGTTIFISLLIYQHSIVSVNDLNRVNLSFFTTNGIASVVFGSLLILDLIL